MDDNNPQDPNAQPVVDPNAPVTPVAEGQDEAMPDAAPMGEAPVAPADGSEEAPVEEETPVTDPNAAPQEPAA